MDSRIQNTLRHFHVLSGLSLVAQAAMRLVPRPGKPCKTACKNQNKNSNTLLTYHSKTNGFHFRRNTLHRQAHRLDVVRRRQASSGSDSTKAAPEEIQSRTRRDARPAGHGSPHSLHRTRHQAHRRAAGRHKGIRSHAAPRSHHAELRPRNGNRRSFPYGTHHP